MFLVFHFFVVIPGHNLGNSHVSVYRTIGPTLVSFFLIVCEIFCICIAVAMCDKLHHVETILFISNSIWNFFEILSDDWETLLNCSFPCIIRNL